MKDEMVIGTLAGGEKIEKLKQKFSVP